MPGRLPALILTFAILPSAPGQNPGSDGQSETNPPPVEKRLRAAGRDLVAPLRWRNVGPANPMGRITDLEVPVGHTSTWYAGTAGGGVWRTRNAGTTWENVFDRQGSVSIGDIATAPSNPDVVWIGTGEENARNSVQWGDGIYKSTDGGESFTHMGLAESFQIGHIAIHPTNPDIVFVAALGHLWGPNPERGVYRTQDGGASWQLVHHIDEKTGCIDVRIDPQNPQIIYACMFARERHEFDTNDPEVRFGEGAGLFRSDDSGDSWQQLTNGLPGCTWGRSGIDLWQEDPNTLFLIVETERSGWAMGDRKDRLEGDPIPEEERQRGQGARRRMPRGTAIMGIPSEGEDGGEDTPGAILSDVTEGGPAADAGLQAGDRITAIDGEDVPNYGDLLEIIRDSRGGQKVQVTFVRGEQTEEVELTFGERQSGGNQFPNGIYGGRLNGQQANRQQFQGDLGHETGGIFRSDDRGETWRRINSLTERPFYYSVIRVDPRSTDHIYSVGTSLWATHDGGEKFAAINQGIHVDFHAVWINPGDSNHLLAGCDGGVNESFDQGKTWQVHQGFSAAQYYDIWADNSVPYKVIGGLQDNGTWVGPSQTRYREGITMADWVTVYGGDGFGAVTDPVEPLNLYGTSQNGAVGVIDLRARSQTRINRPRPAEGNAKFNWDSPFALSPHNRLQLWHAGNHVYAIQRYAHLDNRQTRADRTPLGSGEGFGGMRPGGGRPRGGLKAEIVSPQLGLTSDGTATSLAESPLTQRLVYVGTDDGALWRGLPDGTWERIDTNLPAMPGPRYVSDIVPSHHDADTVYVTLDGHRSNDFRTYAFVSEDRGDTWRALTLDLPLSEPCYAIMEDPRNRDLLFLGTEYGCHVSIDRGEHWHRLGDGLPTVAVRDIFLHDRDSDLVLGTHGRGVWILDIAPLRDVDSDVLEQDSHLFQPEDVILWRMTSRGYSGNRHYKAPNPDYGASFYVYLAEDQDEPITLTVHDVAGKELASLRGHGRRGIQRLHWNARVENRIADPGSYACRLEHDGRTTTRGFTLHPDPLTGQLAAPAASTPDYLNSRGR